jgi:hypothetical protein
MVRSGTRPQRCNVRSLRLLDEPLIGVQRDEGADDRCYQHIWHRRRDDAL